MSSFLFPRRISITRPASDRDTDGSSGPLAYGGLDVATETTVPLPKNLQCSIQYKASSGIPEANVPSGAVSAGMWVFLIPRRVAPPPGTIQNRDIITDDLGNRYQIASDYSHPMGWTIRAERLEA
ncbi:hypothetical protein ACLBYG_22370 [Methylobacterium sp. D53M]